MPPPGATGDGKEVAVLHAQLVRCMETTNQLHEENLKLLQEREHWQAIQRQSEAVERGMQAFKAEYTAKFEQVPQPLLAVRGGGG